MPQIPGVEFLNNVRMKYPDKIRMLLSGSADISTVQDAINIAEVYRYITKPWKTQNLKSSILDAIGRYDLLQTQRRSGTDAAK